MNCYKRAYFGTDKIGRPFYIDCSGSIDVKGIKENTSLDRMWLRYIHSYEELLKLRFLATSVTHSLNIDKTTTAVDLKGFSIGKLWNKETTGFVKTASKIAQDNYPEMMGKMFIINSPIVFKTVWAVIKGWIDEKTRAKIEILGSGYLKKVQEFVADDQIPTFMGGKLEADFLSDKGPWNNFEVVDGTEPGDVVGVRLKDAPDGKIYTPQDMLQWKNPALDPNAMPESSGADGQFDEEEEKKEGE